MGGTEEDVKRFDLSREDAQENGKGKLSGKLVAKLGSLGRTIKCSVHACMHLYMYLLILLIEQFLSFNTWLTFVFVTELHWNCWLDASKVALSVTDTTRQLHELREDANVLKSTIHRLTQELSRYQMKFRKIDDGEVRCRYSSVTSIY